MVSTESLAAFENTITDFQRASKQQMQNSVLLTFTSKLE